MTETVIATYRVKPGCEAEFVALLERHWPTLRRLDLVTEEPPRAYAGRDPAGKPYFVEIFVWRDREAVAAAHEHPDVAAIWNPMGELCASMDFPHVQPLEL